MLSARSSRLVQQTLPVVGGAIDDITSVFYQRMFAAHPELERDLFNRGNQAQGDQQRSLASAFAVYATTLVEESAPHPRELLGRIAHKHASLGVTKDQYPIVHEHLFAAFSEVLGSDLVTAEVAAAWDEVYWLMADDLLTVERDLYAQAGVAPGDVWRRLVVRRRIQESPDTVSFTLARPDGIELPSARPGQYLSVVAPLPDGARQIRQYSLARAPEGTEWVITVKAVPARTVDGVSVPAGQVSTFLHQNVFEGDELCVSLPFGDLVLDDEAAPLLLASAGIGCTPIIGMLHHLVAVGDQRQVQVLHADQSPARHAHRQELKELVAELPNGRLSRWYEDLGVRSGREDLHRGYVDLDHLELTDDVRVYMCGPEPFMTMVGNSLVAQGVDRDRIHYEVFGPDAGEVVAPQPSPG